MNSDRSWSLHPSDSPRQAGSRPWSWRKHGRSDEPRQSRGESLEGLLEAVVADLGITDRLREFRARQAWNDVVGATLAAHSRPLRVRQGRMDVAVPSAVWRAQLSLMKRDIVMRLNTAIGADTIRDLALVNEQIDKRSASQ